jgi:hypothetical protein
MTFNFDKWNKDHMTFNFDALVIIGLTWAVNLRGVCCVRLVIYSHSIILGRSESRAWFRGRKIDWAWTYQSRSCSPADGFIVCLVSSWLPLAVFLLRFGQIKGRIIFQIKLYNIATFDKPLRHQAALHLEKVDLLQLIDCTNYTS